MMSSCLAHILVFTMLLVTIAGCASATSDQAKPKAQEEEKPKRSEPFRY